MRIFIIDYGNVGFFFFNFLGIEVLIFRLRINICNMFYIVK